MYGMFQLIVCSFFRNILDISTDSVHTRLEAEETETEQEGDRKVTFLTPSDMEQETDCSVGIVLFVKRKQTFQGLPL